MEVSPIPLWTWVVPLMPVLMIFRGGLFVPVLLDAAFVTISCTSVELIVCGGSIIALILGFIGGGKIENSSCRIPIVRLLNNSWWVIPLLVWVIFSGSLENLTCASLAVAAFNSYPTSFIVMFLKLMTAVTRLFEFYSLSLENIAFRFSLCGMNSILNVSVVMLLEPVIDSSSYYLTTFRIFSWIFTFG